MYRQDTNVALRGRSVRFYMYLRRASVDARWYEYILLPRFQRANVGARLVASWKIKKPAGTTPAGFAV